VLQLVTHTVDAVLVLTDQNQTVAHDYMVGCLRDEDSENVTDRVTHDDRVGVGTHTPHWCSDCDSNFSELRMFLCVCVCVRVCMWVGRGASYENGKAAFRSPLVDHKRMVWSSEPVIMYGCWYATERT